MSEEHPMPCPFCGGENLSDDHDPVARRISCYTLGCAMNHNGVSIQQWNTRDLESPKLIAEISELKRRKQWLREGLLLIAGSGCEGEDPEQLCKDFELKQTSYCLPCRAAYILEHEDAKVCP